MKKVALFSIVLVLLFSCIAFAQAETENVVQMTCIVKLPDVIREGVYTGEIQDGIPNGYGIFETTNSEGLNWHYIGSWVNGEMSGDGGCYWDNGQCHIGTYENGNLVSGFMRNSLTEYGWVDYRPDENGRIKIKMFRADDSICFEGYADPRTGNPSEGTIYTKSGKVFFSGTIGEGFDWNLIYVE